MAGQGQDQAAISTNKVQQKKGVDPYHEMISVLDKEIGFYES